MFMHWRKVPIVVTLHHFRGWHVRLRIWIHGNGMIAREVDEMTGDATVWDSMHRWCSGHIEILLAVS